MKTQLRANKWNFEVRPEPKANKRTNLVLEKNESLAIAQEMTKETVGIYNNERIRFGI